MNMNQFQNFDLGLSAALISIGYELESLDKSNLRRVQFNFVTNDNLAKAVRDYFSDKLDVNARTYFDNIKLLKSMIYMRQEIEPNKLKLDRGGGFMI